MDRRQGLTVKTLLALALLLILLSGCNLPTPAAPAATTVSVPFPSPSETIPATSPAASVIERTHPPSATPLPTITTTPVPTATSTSACTAAVGVIYTHKITVPSLTRPLQFNLYLPPCYDPEKAGGYPLLVMLHGQSYKQDQWMRLGMLDSANALMSAGEIPPFLIVMPYEEFSLEPPFETGYDDALTDGLLPWLEANYNLCAERACRAIGGLSRGGSWALYIGFTRWQLFGSIGGHSTPPFLGTDSWLGLWLGDMTEANYPRMYLDFGETDWLLEYMEPFRKKLVGYDFPHVWILREGGHTESYWSAHQEEYLRWYAEAWGD